MPILPPQPFPPQTVPAQSIAPQAAPPVPRYLLQRPSNGPWCAYAMRREWTHQINTHIATDWAEVTLANHRPSAVEIFTSDEPGSGDWSIDDRYRIRSDGQVTALVRVVVNLTDNTQSTTHYELRRGKLQPTYRSRVDLTTSSPVDTPADWTPEAPLRTRLSQFPFRALLPLTPRPGKPVCR